MGLSSLFRKKPQEPEAIEGAFSSRAEDDSNAVRGRTRRKASKSGNAPVDPVLPEKKRARRRLVGAVALVLGAIIGLPMVLDSEPKPLGDDVVIQIPSKEQTAPAQAQPLPRRRAEATAIAPAAALDTSEEMIDPPLVVPVAKAVAVAKAVENDKAAGKHKGEPAGAQSKPVVKIAAVRMDNVNAPAATAKSAVAEDRQDSARARAILDGAGDAAKTEKAARPATEDAKKPVRMMLQVAALGSKEKVAELQDKLKAAGLASHTQTVSTESGEKIRVRIGPFASKEEADKARAKLSGIGLNGSLVPS